MIKVKIGGKIRYEYCESAKGEIYGVLAGEVDKSVFGPLLGEPLKGFKKMLAEGGDQNAI